MLHSLPDLPTSFVSVERFVNKYDDPLLLVTPSPVQNSRSLCGDLLVHRAGTPCMCKPSTFNIWGDCNYLITLPDMLPDTRCSARAG